MSDQSDAAAEQGHDYVVAYTAANLAEAEFYKGMLQANDIPAIIMGEASETIGLGESAFARGTPVLVPDTMAEEAKAIIDDQTDAGDYDEDEGDDEQQ